MEISIKKLFVFVTLMTIAVSGFAQLSQISICGIKMGTEKEKAESILVQRFGYNHLHRDSGNLCIANASVGGIFYQYLTFYFVWENGISKFNGASFSSPYELSQQASAIEHRDIIKSIYGRKYYLQEYRNEDGFQSYYFGENDDEIYGCIILSKGIGKDNKKRLYVETIYYGPYDETNDI